MQENKAKVLIVDDDTSLCECISQYMIDEGFTPLIAYNGETALKMIQSQKPDVLVLDVKLPDMNGLDVLRNARKLDTDLQVIIITGYAAVQGAVEAMKGGACNYLAKPFKKDDLVETVLVAMAKREEPRPRRMADRVAKPASLHELMGTSNIVNQIAYEVNRVAETNFNVLILGETGTGKDIVAHAIHEASPRRGGPFVPVDCGAIPETLVESELFGHEKGAFTGASARTIGKFQAAKGGTLFMDEISNLPPISQAKLLRAIQEKTVYPVGSAKPVPVDVRLVAASNTDLPALAVTGSFRSDLLFRLNEFFIKVPPLRQRKEDIVHLTRRFLDLANMELNKQVEFSEDAVEALLAYDWPGNVRELQSYTRRAALLADGVIHKGHLVQLHGFGCNGGGSSAASHQFEPTVPDDCSLREIVRRNVVKIERDLLIQVLRKTGGNKAKAARLLCIDYKTIHTKVKQYCISVVIGGSDDER